MTYIFDAAEITAFQGSHERCKVLRRGRRSTALRPGGPSLEDDLRNGLEDHVQTSFHWVPATSVLPQLGEWVGLRCRRSSSRRQRRHDGRRAWRGVFLHYALR